MTRSPRFSPERRGRRLPPPSLLLLLAGFILAGVAPAAAQPRIDPGEARARARAVLADPRFQHTLPDHAPGDAPKPPPEESSGGFGSEPARVVLPVLGAGALLAKAIFIVLLLVAVLLIVGWSVQAIGRRRAPAGAASGSMGASPDAAAVPGRELAFDDAARLAAEGRYAEAVHALLIAAIRHFAERSRVAIQPSRTSRELVTLLPLGPDARGAFADLVRTVELSLFGGAPVGPEDYERNLERFRDLTRRPA